MEDTYLYGTYEQHLLTSFSFGKSNWNIDDIAHELLLGRGFNYGSKQPVIVLHVNMVYSYIKFGISRNFRLWKYIKCYKCFTKFDKDYCSITVCNIAYVIFNSDDN